MKRRSGKLASTHDREIMLFMAYLRILKRDRRNFGEKFKSLRVTDRYREAGELVGFGFEHSRKIICQMLKTVVEVNEVDKEEYNAMLDELELLRPSQLERTVMGLDRILQKVGVSATHEEVLELTQTYLLQHS